MTRPVPPFSTQIMEYEYEGELESSYRASLIKSFKKQVDDGFFPFIIVDCINDQVSHFSEMANYAKKNDFEVSVVANEAKDCLKSRNCFQVVTFKVL